MELNGNMLGVEGVTEIIDAVESGNFGVVNLGLFANELLGRQLPPGQSATAPAAGGEQGLQQGVETDSTRDSTVASSEHAAPAELYRPSPAERQAEERALSHQIQDRLKLLLERNRTYTRRIHRAAKSILAPARILLNAREASSEMTAQRIIQDVGRVESASGPSSVLSSASTSRNAITGILPHSSPAPNTHSLNRPFPLLELPSEVLQLIVRHCSGDAYALSEKQFAKLRTDVAGDDRAERMLVIRKKRTELFGAKERSGVDFRNENRKTRESNLSKLEALDYMVLEDKFKGWCLSHLGLDKWEMN